MRQLRWPAFLIAGLLYLATALFLGWLLPVLPMASWSCDAVNTFFHPRPERDILITLRSTSEGVFGPIQLRDLRTGRVMKSLLTEEQQVGWVEASADGRWLAWGHGRVLHVIDLTTDQEVYQFAQGRHGGRWVFSPKGKTLAYDSTEVEGPSPRNALVFVDLLTGKEKYRLAGQCTPVAFSPEGKLLATGTPAHAVFWPPPVHAPEVKLWDAATGELQATWMGKAPVVAELAFSPCGQYLWTRGYLDTTSTSGWEKPLAQVWNVEERRPVATMEKLWPGTFVPGAKQVLTFQHSMSGWARRYELQTRDVDGFQVVTSLPLWELPTDATSHQLLISPDTRYAVCLASRPPIPSSWRQWLAARCSWISPPGIRYEVRVTDRHTGTSMEPLLLSSPQPNISMDMAFFSRDGTTLYTIHPNLVCAWALPLSRPWAHILGWPLLPAALWLLWRWRVLHKRQAIGS